jgi:hypothetical protein
MELETTETDAFIQSRDSLVHTGRFLCQRNPDSSVRPFEEFSADLHFLDRIFARLMDWDGEIIDWRDHTGNTRRKA